MPHPDSPSPEEEDRLRRLLADARATEPMPAEVAERLDARLDDLEAERSGATGGDVVPLDRRRRRTVAGILAAAAVVVVAGVGVQQVLTQGGSGDATSTAESAPAVQRDDAGAGAADEEAAGEDGALNSAPQSTDTLSRELPVELREVAGPVPQIAEQRLERAALRIRRDLPPRAEDERLSSGAVLYAPADFTCDPAAWGPGVFVGVEYAGRSAVLAFREPSEQTQVAEVLQCGTGDGLRSVTLSAP